VPLPAELAAVAVGRPTRCVWQNQEGGLTFEIGFGEPGERHFVKWVGLAQADHLDAEAERLAWAGRFVAVPHVVAHGRSADGAWLVTVALPGANAVAARWRAEPGTAVRAVGAGLRAFHDALPVTDCPFSWSVADRLADVHRRDDIGLVDPSAWFDQHRRLGRRRALEVVEGPPPVDQLVVGHGDACVPNTLIGDDGRWTGHVDLGALGVADRWADLAVATWSTVWNYGPGWEEALLEAYGVEPDPERTAYYQLLWDLGP